MVFAELGAALFRHSVVGLLLADDQRRYVAANPVACDILGRVEDDLIGRRVDDLIDGSDADEIWREFRAKGALSGVIALRRPGGDCIHVDFRATANLVPGLHLSQIRLVLPGAEHAHDAELRAESLQRELGAAEELQRKLAADLHDTVGQDLALLKLMLQRLQHQPSSVDLGEATRRIDTLLRQIRTAVFELHPAALDDLGLIPALQDYADHLSAQHGIAVRVDEIGVRRELTLVQARALFRCTRELVTNALKHAAPSEVLIAAHWSRKRLRLVVDDDGRGFDAHHATHGFGLVSVAARIANIGGTLLLDSRIGDGTRVALDLPLDEGM